MGLSVFVCNLICVQLATECPIAGALQDSVAPEGAASKSDESPRVTSCESVLLESENEKYLRKKKK